MNTKARASITCVLAFIFLGACSSFSKIPATGTFYEEPVDTTVDSEIARYYLESYLPGKRGNPGMDDRISELYDQYDESIPSREDLKRISQEFSVDFASLFLADRLLKNECNKNLNHSFAHYLKNPVAVDANLSSYRLLFVPGWDYVVRGHLTGADFRKPRELATEFGIENYLVEVQPTGSVEENAKILAKEIIRHARSGKEIILAGASSAGPAIHLALGELLDERERDSIKAWVNLGGILQGSPYIDHIQGLPQSLMFNVVVLIEGWDKEAILSMGTRPSRKRFSRLKLDTDMLVINYMGIPLSGQLSQHSKDKYPILRSGGPNDGLTLLADMIAPNSLTIVALGSDHYFAEDPEIDKKTIALIKLVITYLEKDIVKSCN